MNALCETEVSTIGVSADAIDRIFKSSIRQDFASKQQLYVTENRESSEASGCFQTSEFAWWITKISGSLLLHNAPILQLQNVSISRLQNVPILIACERIRQGPTIDNLTRGLPDFSSLTEILLRDDPWLCEAIALNNSGRSGDALDIVYDQLDDWLLSGDFKKVDAFLRRLPVETIAPRLLYAIAIIARPASEHLHFWAQFLDRAWKTLESNGKDARRLLGRLQADHESTAKRSRHVV